MQIGRKDVIWNIAATFMRVASGLIVLPLVLRLLSVNEVAMWGIFLNVGSFATLLDFGFSNSFTRNISYIFGGVKTLKSKGFNIASENEKEVDFSLLKSVISSMRFFYGIISGAFLLFYAIASPYYLQLIFNKNAGYANTHHITLAWYIYGVLVAYQLYTYYYNSLLTGRGQVKNVLQITIIGQASRIISSVIFLLLGYGLISLVIGQFICDVINRTLCYLAFYNKETKRNLKISNKIPIKQIMGIMTPNAIRIGITSIGSFFINKMVMFIGPTMLIAKDIASFTTTQQMINLIISFGGIWIGTYYPQINLYRVNNNQEGIKRLYLKSKLNMFLSFFICGLGLIFIVPELLEIIRSKTQLLPSLMILAFLVFAYLDANQGLASTILLTKNEVPFAKAVILSGLGTLVLLYLSLKYSNLGLWGMVLSAGIAQSLYQNWKWPLLMKKELNIKLKDYVNLIIDILKRKEKI